MGTVIVNGTLVTASETFPAELRMEDGRIAAVGCNLARPGDEVVDAGGLLVMPGGVDVHTHLDLPSMGTVASDDFESGTLAAVFGGTTSIVDFVTPAKGKTLTESLELWRQKAEGRAVIDYGLHMSVTEMAADTLEQMEAVFEQGVTSFKVFTAYPGVLMLDDAAILRALRWSAKRGALIQVHAENGLAIAELVASLAAEGKLEPRHHAASRPSVLEGEASARVLALAEVAGAPVYLVHLTCREALEAVRSARVRGVRAFAETCPQYLYLSDDKLALPDFEGAKFVCSPPLRDNSHAPALWQGLCLGDLQVVATDHCPFNFKGQKEAGRGDFRKIPNGLPGIETRLTLVHQGVVEGRLSINRFVDVVATAPAKMFGLHPRKGVLAPGADADVVIWDPQKRVDLSAARLHMRVDYSLYEGQVFTGGPAKVFVGGRLTVDGDRFLGKAGDGRFLRRRAFVDP